MINSVVAGIIILLMTGTTLADDNYISIEDKVATVKIPNVPDPNVILQGGDTVNDATVIDALPYTTTGTTTGYTNDYDEVCPYDSSTSPDVVYSYTPANDIVVDISLCSSSTYDTKLYVYENVVGNLVDCADDNCPDFQSELLELELTGGNTYYIIVDGYGTEHGNYSFDMQETLGPPPPPNCDQSLFGQVTNFPEDSAWSAATSDAGTSGSYLVYDNFDTGGIIGGVKFWGLDLIYNNGWIECYEPQMTFEIAFYEDSNDQPGNLIESFTVICDARPTDLFYLGYELNEYYAILDQPFQINSGWVSIQGISDPQNCWFLWMSSTGLDDRHYQWHGDSLELQEYDQGYCLYPEINSIYENPELLPTDIDMLSAYPNPFNAKTTVVFSLKNPGDVKIAIHDLLGRQVDVIDLGYLSNGAVHTITYDADRLATGVYYYSLLVDGEMKTTRKFSLLK